MCTYRGSHLILARQTESNSCEKTGSYEGPVKTQLYEPVELYCSQGTFSLLQAAGRNPIWRQPVALCGGKRQAADDPRERREYHDSGIFLEGQIEGVNQEGFWCLHNLQNCLKFLSDVHCSVFHPHVHVQYP